MHPSTVHRFHHVTAGVRLEMTWSPPPVAGKNRLRTMLRRLILGGPDPSTPRGAVPQASFDRALELLNADPSLLADAEDAFRRLGYSVRRTPEAVSDGLRA